MSILDRLKLHHPRFKQTFDTSIHQPEQLNILLAEQPALALEYDSLCVRFVALLNECQLHPESLVLRTRLQQTLKEAQQLNANLLYLYDHSATFADAKARLQKHRERFNVLMGQKPEAIPPQAETRPESKDKKDKTDPVVQTAKASIFPLFVVNFFASVRLGLSKLRVKFFEFLNWIRAKISEHNIIRLFFARFRRGLLNVKNLVDTMTTNSQVFNTIFEPFDKYFFGPLMNFLSWLFLLQRLIVNIILTAWQVIAHNGLSEKERKLNWLQRLLIEWRERWFEFANELIWVPGGIWICFFAFGALNIVGLILGVAMFGWDVVMSITRATIELIRLNKLIHHHIEQLTQLTTDAERQNQLDFIQQLKTHRSYEIKRHALSIANNTAVTLLSFLAVSIVAFPPIVPIIASVLLLIITICVIYLNQRLASIKPDSKLESLEMSSYDNLLKTMPVETNQPEFSPTNSSEYSPLLPRNLHEDNAAEFQLPRSASFS